VLSTQSLSESLIYGNYSFSGVSVNGLSYECTGFITLHSFEPQRQDAWQRARHFEADSTFKNITAGGIVTYLPSPADYRKILKVVSLNDPLEFDVRIKIIVKISPYRKENTTRLNYKDPLVNSV
jgi:hypothetical protein